MLHDSIKSTLYHALRECPLPLFVFEDRIIPAASVWTGARRWVRLFRDAGLEPGERVVLALDPSPAWLMVAVACLWEGLPLALACPQECPHDAANSTDARAIIAPAINTPDHHSGPPATLALRRTGTAPTPQVTLLMRTSGTSGEPRWIALSDTSIMAVLKSHAHLAEPRDGAHLSILPWHHAFGLIIDLVQQALARRTIVRDPSGGRDANSILRLARQYDCTTTGLVPLQVRRLVARPEGAAYLRSLEAGIVGGAAVDAATADLLAGTRLRVGYGQTEASPGIALGEPGHWSQGHLGRPLGCDIRIDHRGELWFQGDNACLGEFEDGALLPAAAGWRSTGDLVERQPDGSLRFTGRIDDDFKLGNGRMVRVGAIEQRLVQRLGLLEAAVVSPDGDRLALCLVTDNAHRPSADDAIDCLGPLGPLVSTIAVRTPEQMPRTAKGALNRAALASELRLTIPARNAA